MGTLLLNSRGLHTKQGADMIYRKLVELGVDQFDQRVIYLVSLPEYGVDSLIVNNCINMGFKRENIYLSSNGIPENVTADIVYVTEGNTFEVLSYMREKGFVKYIKDVIKSNNNRIYIGSSAGAMIAGTDVRIALDFDKNFVKLNDFSSLALFEGTIIPHYTKKELNRYIRCTEKSQLSRYKKIYSVGNEQILMIKTS